MPESRALEEILRERWRRRYPTASAGALDRAVSISLEGVDRALRGESSFDEATRRGGRVRRILDA